MTVTVLIRIHGNYVQLKYEIFVQHLEKVSQTKKGNYLLQCNIRATEAQRKDRGELSYTQKQGVITLLHKGNELDKDDLNNWRPITLTNTDYKILAKVLAERLSGVIPKLVSEDQVGYIRGRNIATSKNYS